MKCTLSRVPHRLTRITCDVRFQVKGVGLVNGNVAPLDLDARWASDLRFVDLHDEFGVGECGRRTGGRWQVEVHESAQSDKARLSSRIPSTTVGAHVFHIRVMIHWQHQLAILQCSKITNCYARHTLGTESKVIKCTGSTYSEDGMLTITPNAGAAATCILRQGHTLSY